jgi:tetratricopeptide (TPR) repeat protein
MKTPRFIAAYYCVVLAAGSVALRADEPFFDGLGTYERKITTTSPEAQKYFNQGLRFLFGFNHGGAIRAFSAAAKADPDCAMAHWGIALANGPHINFPIVPPPAAEAAWRELTLARTHAANASAAEQALIEALGKRYANPQPEDRRPLDEAYAAAMRAVWQANPQDAEAGVLFAEAMLDLRPWDQWTADGKPQPGTEEVIQTLDAVLKLRPDHPFANHLYIHTLEASPHPERANAAAERLRNLQPGLAHNVHMPSHIDIRCGRWLEAVDGNLKAIAADKNYRAIVGPPRDLIIVYAAHNRHMLAYAAMMTGQSELALTHIRAMVAEMPEAFVKEYALMAEGFMAMPYEVLVRFGRWDEILQEPEPAEYMPLSRVLRHAARGVAFAARNEVKAAREEQALFEAGSKNVPAEETFGNNGAAAVVEVARRMLAGEILYREGRVNDALTELKAGVAAEDSLHYDEPPGWILPVRHALGATLIQERRFAEAEEVYRDDLKRLPDNGWSLFGLSRCLRARDEKTEAATVEERFKQIWSKADIAIASSCLCQPGVPEKVAADHL